MPNRSGVAGISETDAALARVPDDVAAGARAVDVPLGGRMVDEMRSRVKVDSGRLLNGISARQDGDGTVVEATAVRGDFDYARIEEFGRHADTGFFASAEGGAVDPDPFFYPAVHDVLSGREPAMDGVIDAAGRKEGFR